MSKKLEQAISDIINASAMIQSDYNDKFIDGDYIDKQIAQDLKVLDNKLDVIKKDLLFLNNEARRIKNDDSRT